MKGKGEKSRKGILLLLLIIIIIIIIMIIIILIIIITPCEYFTPALADGLS